MVNSNSIYVQANCLEIGGGHAGKVYGLANMMASISGIAAPLVAKSLTKNVRSTRPRFKFAALLQQFLNPHVDCTMYILNRYKIINKNSITKINKLERKHTIDNFKSRIVSKQN